MLNKIQFIGHLGKDPEVRYLASGVAVANFSVASSEKWKDKASGEQQERTEWLRCNAFDRLAEICGDYLKKGSLVYVEGKMQTRKYTDKDGIDRYVTECRVNEMKMLGGKSDEGGDRPTQEQRENRAAAKTAAAPKQSTGFDAMDDDIPF